MLNSCITKSVPLSICRVLGLLFLNNFKDAVFEGAVISFVGTPEAHRDNVSGI
jgi:hypothetical protein